MALPTIFDLCRPRADVKGGEVAESDYAADLAHVLKDEGPAEYRDAATFLANTFPTRGLKTVLESVCLRLRGAPGAVSPILRLDTQYGGGKTHALIALSHAARGFPGAPPGLVAEFLRSDLLPTGPVRLAAFDGENSDPASGRSMGDGIKAFTPWGELAYRLAGKAGYERIRRSDEEGIAPGADTLRELFGGQPTLILLDELSLYLRKVRVRPKAEGQLTAFLTGLFKAVEGTRDAAIVYTLAISAAGRATDAYADENRYIADRMAEAESVSARKATILDPTAEDETAQVLRRRLFSSIDDAGAGQVVEAYAALWNAHKDALPPTRAREDRVADLRRSYPLHPALLRTMTDKLSTLGNFQRVRGMLRLLVPTVAHLWRTRPADAHAIHLHHLDPAQPRVKQEILTKLGLSMYEPALRVDVASAGEAKASLAEDIDAQHYAGLPPYASYVARTILLSSFAFNDTLKGVSPEELRLAAFSPALDPAFVRDAERRFKDGSNYMDDRPGVSLRILTEANLTQVIRRQEQNVDPEEARAQLKDRIASIFAGVTGGSFNVVPFASHPQDVPDDDGNGRPCLVLIGYEADAVQAESVSIPPLVEKIFRNRGSAGTDFRKNLNNVVFLVADETLTKEMRQRMVHRLALEDLRRPERLQDLADHQRDKVQELFRRSEQELATAIQQCYRHVFYPSRNRVEGATIDLAHAAIDVPSASERPGAGQQQVVRTLRDVNKLRTRDDNPDSPTFVRDRTPLKKGQITTADLRAEFRRDPALPMLVGDDVFLAGIRRGVEDGAYVYKRGELVYGKGDPAPEILVDEQAWVLTDAFAREKGLWPRRPKDPPKPDDKEGPGAGPTAPPPPPPQPDPTDIVHEGPLREALTRVWETARSRKVKALAALSLQLFDGADAFKMLGAIGTIPNAEKMVTIEGGYGAKDGSSLRLQYTGTPAEAGPVREFLEAQHRAAAHRELSVSIDLRWAAGFPVEGEEPARLTERLVRFAAGAAYVRAKAQVHPPVESA